MKIHFVCSHNTFRSRVAETYLKSLKIPNIEVSSSGTEAHLDYDGPVTWYAQRLFKNYNLSHFEKKMWDQTDEKTLNEQDLIIFMQRKHLDECIQKFNYQGKNYQIWNIPDFEEGELNDDKHVIDKSEKIFRDLKEKINKLISQ